MTAPEIAAVRWPAEWEPQSAIWMAWPHQDDLWPTDMGPVRATFARLIALLGGATGVELLVPDEETAAVARAAVAAGLRTGEAPRLRCHLVDTDDCWLRDSGPIFVHGAGGPQAVGWGFNGWGKFEPYDLDAAVPGQVARLANVPLRVPGVVLEGGSIDGDGAGTVLTTEQCLLQPNRNPGLGKLDYERLLRQHLGVARVVWLGDGMHNDHTDGHVDVVARFVAPGRVVTHVTHDRSDPNWPALADNLARLHAARDATGRRLEVLELPIPEPVVFNGKRLAASYVNFVIANGLVVVPTYRSETDAAALALLRGCFPRHRVVGLPAVEILRGGGAFHCVTQQQPA